MKRPFSLRPLSQAPWRTRLAVGLSLLLHGSIASLFTPAKAARPDKQGPTLDAVEFVLLESPKAPEAEAEALPEAAPVPTEKAPPSTAETRAAPAPTPSAPAPTPSAPAEAPSAPAPFATGITLSNQGASAERAAPGARGSEGTRASGASALKAAAGECGEAPERPRPIEQPQAITYPASARSRGIEGRLVLRLRIRSDGSVAEVQVVEGLEAELDRAAVEAVRSWRFSPEKRCGKAVEGSYVLARRFELGQG